MYLMIDNYDSFTYNLYALFRQCGAEVHVIRNSEYVPADEYRGIIISPGPSTPDNAGSSMKYLEQYGGKKPIFGVCLGMQCIGSFLGYPVVRAKTVRHGKVDTIKATRDSVLLRNCPESIRVVRYHSLAVEADERHVTSLASHDGTVMSLEDREKLLFGVQFHPESIMSEAGKTMVQNFIDFAEAKKMVSVSDVMKKMNSGDLPTTEEAEGLFEAMLSGSLSEGQIASVLISMKNRGERPEELAALVTAMHRHKKRFMVNGRKLVDTCGTGGDGKSTVNVSTAVSIILGSMGYGVVKHGNSAQSGKVGSADILARCGFDATYAGSTPEEFFARHNFVFLFAPHYHPALKGIGKVRRELGVPTIFNFVGPLANPADPDYQIIGLPTRDRLDLLTEAVRTLGRKRVALYSSEDGYDEISSNGKTECRIVSGGEVSTMHIDPAEFFEPFPMPVVADDTAARDLFLGGLSGSDEKVANIFALNAALALMIMDEGDLKEGFRRAKDECMSGRAAEKLRQLVGGAERSIA